MIRYEIEHTTRYHYSRPVFIEPFIVRLRPRSDSTQSLFDYKMTVSPTPSGSTECVDLDGNDTTALWFEGLHEELHLETSCRVETKRENPYDFVISDEGCLKVPVVYPGVLAASLAPYLDRRDASPDVTKFAKGIAETCRDDTLIFLSRLNFRIASEFEIGNREIGNPFPPDVTLASRSGACRDVAEFFMDACRSVGLAARFVSGYQEGEDIAGQKKKDSEATRDLHAWAEVYLPGGGWRGYDPSHGIAVADRHVALAAAAQAELAAPTSGAFRGTGATSEITYEISIRAEELEDRT